MASVMEKSTARDPATSNSRRSFIKKGIAAGAVGVGYALFADAPSMLTQTPQPGPLSAGDAALLRFAAAAEILETDFWLQYNELGGIQDSEVPGGTGNPAYTAKLQVLDTDFSQYIHDNTDDEITHFTFLNAYLESKGAQPVNLDAFRTLPGSKATGSSGQMRLTNLMQLTVDTSWWTRYRSSDNNPDLDPNFTFPQAVRDLSKGQFTLSPGPTTISAPTHTSRPSPTRRVSICLRLNKVEPACTLPWRSEPAA